MSKDTLDNATKPVITWKEIIADVRDRILYQQIYARSIFYRPLATRVHPITSEQEAEEACEAARARTPCNACAMGALMIGALGLGATWRDTAFRGIHRVNIIETLSPYFSQRTLELMEIFFEGYDYPPMDPPLRQVTPAEVRELHPKIREYGNSPSREAILIKILDNVEANNGEFVP
jgi:hypothetical protein